MKIGSWNVNGIRAVSKTGFLNWLDQSDLQVIGLQETKAQKEQLEETILSPKGYASFWHSATDKGYSGVSFYYKKEPLNVIEGIGDPEIDCEGRVLTFEYKNFYFVNAYFPNSGRDHKRLPFKLKFCKKMYQFLNRLRERKNVVICGDFNIAHQEIDLANPKSNKKNAGFLPEERAWMSDFLQENYVDVFRYFSADPAHYTWWSYRPGVRQKNIGWRLDYFCTDKEFIKNIKQMKHLNDVWGSDHCPIVLEMKK